MADAPVGLAPGVNRPLVFVLVTRSSNSGSRRHHSHMTTALTNRKGWDGHPFEAPTFSANRNITGAWASPLRRPSAPARLGTGLAVSSDRAYSRNNCAEALLADVLPGRGRAQIGDDSFTPRAKGALMGSQPLRDDSPSRTPLKMEALEVGLDSSLPARTRPRTRVGAAARWGLIRWWFSNRLLWLAWKVRGGRSAND